MKSYLILLPIFFLALLQGAVLPFNLVLLVVLIWMALRPAKEGLLVAFLAGIFLDLAKGTQLGLSSIVLLFACYFLLLYRRRFDPAHPAFLAIFVFVSLFVFDLVTSQPWNWLEGAGLSLLALLFRPVISIWSEKEKGIKLKINR